MKRATLLPLLCVVIAAGCAPLPRQSPEHAARMKAAGDAYAECLSQESEKDMKNPADADDIVVAAHGRCWPAWDAYREAARANFFHDVRTPDEKQFAHDRTEAHLREFEREARRAAVDSIIDRTLDAGTRR